MKLLSELNQNLQEAFLFQPDDLEANLRHALSRRQMAHLRGSARMMWISMIVLGVLMLVGLPVIFVALNNSSGSTNLIESLKMGLFAGSIGFGLVLLVMAYYMRGNSGTAKGQLSLTQGVAQPAKGGEYEFRLRIGNTPLRVALELQRDAFVPGVSYRVFHVKQGPIDWVFSAQALAEPLPPAHSKFVALNAADIGKPDPAAERGSMARLSAIGPLIMVAIALAAVGIPLVFVATASLPPPVQTIVYLVMLALAVGFPFLVIALFRRAAPEASAHLDEAEQAAQEMIGEKLDDV